MEANINIYNQDCLEAMKLMEDNHYDLAIIDPPYGILNTSGDRLDKYGTEQKNGGWDSAIPTDEYFEQLFRVSKNQIIWGGNYFPYLWKDGCKGYIFWHKHQPVKNWAAGELAWTSFDRPARCLDYKFFGAINAEAHRFHPTQKPVHLYKWVLMEYAELGNKILDTHIGSGSIALACWDLGFDLDGYEISPTYYKRTMRRLQEHKNQQTLKL